MKIMEFLSKKAITADLKASDKEGVIREMVDLLAKADEIKATVASLVDASAGGKIVVDSRTNSLVITERPSRETNNRVPSGNVR